MLFWLFITNSIKDKKNLMHQNICNGMSSRLIKMYVMISQREKKLSSFILFSNYDLYFTPLQIFCRYFSKIGKIKIQLHELEYRNIAVSY